MRFQSPDLHHIHTNNFLYALSGDLSVMLSLTFRALDAPQGPTVRNPATMDVKYAD